MTARMKKAGINAITNIYVYVVIAECRNACAERHVRTLGYRTLPMI